MLLKVRNGFPDEIQTSRLIQLLSAVLAKPAALVASGNLEVPIAATFPLEGVRTAFRQLEQGHTRGKIILLP
jgi:NADPH:quinone reductase-like Zn-dependent oxidoreductase